MALGNRSRRSTREVWELQRLVGNRAVVSLLDRAGPAVPTAPVVRRQYGDDIDWGSATAYEYKSSGNGGAVIVMLPTGKVVVKSGMSNEVFAAWFARQSGLGAPRTRMGRQDEEADIGRLMARHRESNDKLQPPYLVMEFVPGTTLGDLGKGGGEEKDNRGEKGTVLDAKQVQSLAESFGRWVAFDLVIAEGDRFGRLRGGSLGGFNSSNFLTNPESSQPKIVGIDQNLMSGDLGGGDDIARGIIKQSPMLGYSLALDFESVLESTAVGTEDLGDFILLAAKEQLESMRRFNRQDLEGKAEELGLDDKFVTALLDRIERYR